MDLNLAKYAQGQLSTINPNARPKRPREMFPRRRWETVKQDRGPLVRTVKALRSTAHTRFENHNKQLQHFLDRDRYQQNESWRAEYDRLHALQSNEMTEQIAQRMQDLRDVIVRRQNPKTLY